MKNLENTFADVPVTIRRVGEKQFKFEIWGKEFDDGPFESFEIAMLTAIKRVGIHLTFEDCVGTEKIQMDMT